MEFGLTQALAAEYRVMPLTSDEFDTMAGAATATILGLSVEENYDLVLENYLDLERAVLGTAANWMVRGESNPGVLRNDSALYNRRLLNLLSAARTYVDQVPHHLGEFVTDGPELAGRVFSSAYDTHIGYRAMSALRNYVQHRGMPVRANGYQHVMYKDEYGKQHFAHTALLALVPAELSADGKFKGAVLDELRGLGERIDLMWLARDYLDALSEAHAAIRAAMAEPLALADFRLDDLQRRFIDATLDPSVYLVLRSVNDRGELAARYTVNTLATQMRRDLVARNPAPRGLANGHVSSQSEFGGT
jgi:hypothetical protein